MRNQTNGRTAGAVRGMLARRAVEKTIKGEREAEIQRLDRLAGGGAEPKTTKAGSRLEAKPQMASQHGAATMPTKAKLRVEGRPQMAPQSQTEPKTTKPETGKAQTPTDSGQRSGRVRDKALKW